MRTYASLSDDESFLVYMMGIELDRQRRHLLRANRELRRALRKTDTLAALFYLDALLRCAAAISRIMWPTKKYESRGRLLRRLLHVSGRSPFANRSVRNSFEHFDERIEDWLASGQTLVVDSNIGPKNSFVGQSTLRHLRHLDPGLMEATFLDETVRIDPVVRAAHRLRSKMRGITFMLDAHLDAM